MGGAGSGSYFRFREKKKTVEESLTLALNNFRKAARPWLGRHGYLYHRERPQVLR